MSRELDASGFGSGGGEGLKKHPGGLSYSTLSCSSLRLHHLEVLGGLGNLPD